MTTRWQPLETLVHGPTKEELQKAFFSPNGILGFRSSHAGYLDVILRKVEWEDGSGESWNIEGYVVRSERNQQFKAYWHTGTKSGHCEIQALTVEEVARV